MSNANAKCVDTILKLIITTIMITMLLIMILKIIMICIYMHSYISRHISISDPNIHPILGLVTTSPCSDAFIEALLHRFSEVDLRLDESNEGLAYQKVLILLECVSVSCIFTSHVPKKRYLHHLTYSFFSKHYYC